MDMVFRVFFFLIVFTILCYFPIFYYFLQNLWDDILSGFRYMCGMDIQDNYKKEKAKLESVYKPKENLSPEQIEALKEILLKQAQKQHKVVGPEEFKGNKAPADLYDLSTPWPKIRLPEAAGDKRLIYKGAKVPYPNVDMGIPAYPKTEPAYDYNYEGASF